MATPSEHMQIARGAPTVPANDAVVVVRAIQAAIENAHEKLARIDPERLVSFSITVPVFADLAFAGDTCWFGPLGETAFHASGAAESYATEDAANRFGRDAAQWCCLGDASLAPLAFFTLPPATESGPLKLRIPRLLVRRLPGKFGITLSARRGTQAPQTIVNQWLEEIGFLVAPSAAAKGGPNIVALQTTPDAQEWMNRVASARDAIVAGQLEKVVLARRLCAKLSKPIDIARIAQRLTRIYPGCHVFTFPYADGHVVAASPERLASKRGEELVGHALAGTIKRSGTAQEDARAAAAFLASPKERLEHALVVNAIRGRMLDLCTSVGHAAEPSVVPLRFVQHLSTRVSGRVREGVGLLDAVSHLHPTPAVLGAPAEKARAWIDACGENRDGLYTGVAGWIDRNGDGDAVVVLRSAYVESDSAVLWAGAGIMAQSDPQTELAETELKLQTMLEVLGTHP